jgi:hypothetical protein
MFGEGVGIGNFGQGQGEGFEFVMAVLVFVVFVVIIMVVVMHLVPGLDIVLGGDAEAKQDLGRQAPGAGADKMDTAAGLTGQAAEHGIDVRDHHHVGAGKLVLEQFRQGRFVVDAVIGFALGIDRGLVMGEAAVR